MVACAGCNGGTEAVHFGLGILAAIAGTVIGGVIGQTTTVTLESAATTSTHR